jgi:hypothetical protein
MNMSEYGKSGYRNSRGYVFPEIVPLLDEELKKGARRNCLEGVDALENRIRQGLESQQ